MEGGNPSRTGFFLCGAAGSNGKTTFAQLVSATLGDYAGTLKLAQLTSQKLDSVLKKRVVVVFGPDAGGGIHWSTFKELMGRGAVQVSGGRQHFTPFFMSKGLPSGCVEAARAERSRFHVVPFCSEFVSEPTQPHQLAMDTSLPEKIAGWRPHFFNILYAYYTRAAAADRLGTGRILQVRTARAVVCPVMRRVCAPAAVLPADAAPPPLP